MAPKIIYVTGFRQHAGKTVTCLGLLSLLTKAMEPSRIGYIKPVGQELVKLSDGSKIDKDALIVEEFGGIPDMDMKYVSPVRLASGFTKRYLESKDTILETRKLKDEIAKALNSLAHKEIIIAEGTGHPGVGGIVGLSNAKVAKLIDAEIIFLSGGGIGKALDMLEVDLSYFLYKRSRVRGIIFNKLIPDKIPTVKKYITEELLNQRFGSVGGSLSILGFLPQIEDLSHPSMRVIADSFRDCEVIGDINAEPWKIPCGSINVVTLPDEKFDPANRIESRGLVIISACSTNRIRKVINFNKQLKERDNGTVGGFIFTCHEDNSLDDRLKDEIAESGIPALTLHKDSASTEADILKVFENTKIQIFDKLKIEEIDALFEQYFDMQKFIDSFNIDI